MGGYGSGRTGYKCKAENCRSLDVNRFKREGCLRPGSIGNWVWSQDGEEVARIGYTATDSHLVLNYRIRPWGEDWEPVTEHVPLTHSKCNYGGTRTYFQCPGILNGRACRRRVGKLFLAGRCFLCRHCNNVAYSTQSMPRYDRALHRANQLRIALGGHPGTAHWIAPKPKGMWHRTYEKHVDEILRCESQADQLFLSKFARHLGEEELAMFFD